jgi:hypothetical protein
LLAWRRFAEPNPAICVGTSAGPGTCERYVFDELYLDGAHRKAPHFSQGPRTGRPNRVGAGGGGGQLTGSVTHPWLPVGHTHACCDFALRYLHVNKPEISAITAASD